VEKRARKRRKRREDQIKGEVDLRKGAGPFTAADLR
jgi:hypothetical protein